MKIWHGRGQQSVVVAVLTRSMCGCGGWAGGWEPGSPSWGRVSGLFGGRRADAESWGKLERQETAGTEEGWWTSQEMMRLRTCWWWDTQRILGRQMVRSLSFLDWNRFSSRISLKYKAWHLSGCVHKPKTETLQIDKRHSKMDCRPVMCQ